MKTYLIYCNFIGGHQLEYVHHLYIGALEHPSYNFIFSVPPAFKNVSNKLDWPHASHISIEFIADKYLPQKNDGLFRKVYKNCCGLRKMVKCFNASNVFLITLIEYIPLLIFFLPKSVKVSGVLYRIYLYEWKQENIVKKILDVAKYKIMSWSSTIDRVFVLNDNSGASYLNKLYKSEKYRMLVDPIASLPAYKGIDIREELGISKQKKIYLHPGGMLRRKGTLEILKALLKMDSSDAEEVAVIFAGRVTEEIYKEFTELYELVKPKVQIVLLEGFLSFERLADLFVTCDYVLIPYMDNSKSSGIIGHAAYYRKPVIVAKGGLIGKLVRNWKLGYLIKKPDAISIKQFMVMSHPQIKINNDYVSCHSVENFYNTILS